MSKSYSSPLKSACFGLLAASALAFAISALAAGPSTAPSAQQANKAPESQSNQNWNSAQQDQSQARTSAQQASSQKASQQQAAPRSAATGADKPADMPVMKKPDMGNMPNSNDVAQPNSDLSQQQRSASSMNSSSADAAQDSKKNGDHFMMRMADSMGKDQDSKKDGDHSTMRMTDSMGNDHSDAAQEKCCGYKADDCNTCDKSKDSAATGTQSTGR